MPLLDHTCNIINMRRSGGTPRRASLVFVAVAALLLGTLIGVAPAQHADAAIAATFDPGNIIDDSVFYNSSTMSAQQVQDFLNSKVAGCVGGYTCLKNYTTATSTRAAVANLCTGYTGAASETAAQIIWNVAQSCGVNPQVLIVLLQKEQGLVTSNAPSAGSYRSATGYGCPDTAVCDSLYYGFFNQVYAAAYQFKLYRAYPSSYNFVAGRMNSIQYSPNSACGTSSVFIANQATAGLYDYTPYTPNAAAMANLYGTGDSCSAYGNRNFWAYFTDWFGPTTADAQVPFGSFDSVAGSFGSMRIRGWTIDPNTTSAVTINVYVDGAGAAIAVANTARPDVDAAYPQSGTNHGFDLTLAATTGTHTVCIYAINQLAGTSNPLIGCKSVTVAEASPQGALTSTTPVPGTGVELSGWAVDPETSNPIQVQIYQDGALSSSTTASVATQVPSQFSSLGTQHGYDVTVPTSVVGTHTYCAYGINVGYGSNALLGCLSARVLAGGSTGSVDRATTQPGTISVAGWALDYDTASSIPVHVYVDGVGQGITANQSRPDVAAVFPGYGDAHGYSLSVPASAGEHQVCVYAIHVGAGSNVTLGCTTVSVPGGSPIGSLDSVTASAGTVSVAGWSIDPDVTASIPVDVYVDGVGAGRFTAASSRADVAAVYPDYGSSHGFAISIPVASGLHTVCVYGINTGIGSNSTLGCQSVNAP